MTICLICNADIDTNTTPSTCHVCHCPYHPSCVVKTANGEIQNCIKCSSSGRDMRCIPVPNAPKSRKSKSKMVSHMSCDSEKDGEIRAIEEQIEMERRQSAEKLKLLEKSHLREKTLMDKKISLIREITSSRSSSVQSVESSRRRVKQWNADFENAEKVQPPPGKVYPTALVDNLVKEQLSSTKIDPIELNRCVISRTPIKDLPKFSGDPLEWPVFIASYETSTSVYNIQNSENLIRLQNCLKGDALEAVKGTLIFPEKVPDAVHRLKLLFGRPEYIISQLQSRITEFAILKMDKFNTIIEFATYVESMVLTMQQAKLSDHLRNPTLMLTIVQKLPTQMQLDWAKHQNQHRDNGVCLEVLSKWLTDRSMECCSLLSTPPTFKCTQESKGKVKHFVNIHEDKKQRCLLCEGDCASVAVCDEFLKMDYKSKWSVVNQNLCRHCLKPHKGRCYSKSICGIDGCTFKHHKLLHKRLIATPQADNNFVATHAQRETQVYFKIVPIVLFNGDKTLHTYALLDDGSQVTLAEKWIFQQLDLKGVNSPLTLKWTGNQHKCEEDSITFSVQAGGKKDRFWLNKVRTVQDLELPSQTIDVTELQDSYEHLQNLPLTGYENAKPCMLIGLNNAKLLTVTRVKEGKCGEPIAAKSKFGWLVYGSDGMETGRHHHSFHICDCQQEKENCLNEMVRSFIALDNLYATGSKRETLSTEDKRALDIMKSTIKFDEGKYEIGLLWRFKNFLFPDSFAMAVKRLECLEKQMKKEPTLRQKFIDQINSYIENGYARKLSKEEVSFQQPCWYLPMFLVRNANKPNKIRPVWDAAAVVKNISLNSTLLKGPDQLAQLPGVLSRFRQYEFGITADIKEMFHQVRVRKEDQQFQRFLWLSSMST